jgi:hypothetical protein
MMRAARLALLCICCVVVVLTAVAAGSPTVSACTSRQVSLHVSAQGENETAAIDFLVTDDRSACRLNGEASLAVVQSGRLISAVRGNPLRQAIDAVIQAGQSSLLIANWENWCGSRTDLRLRATIGSRVTTGRFLNLPVCLYPKKPSRLTKVSQ